MTSNLTDTIALDLKGHLGDISNHVKHTESLQSPRE